MLEWLSNGRPADSSHRGDDDFTIDDDAPATPAPVFAARAFKHLIWGTPAPEEMAKQRGHLRRTASESDHREVKTPPRRSTSERAKKGHFIEPSPAKRPGILLTPGTGGMRRKTVSFEGKANGAKTGLSCDSKTVATPRDVPGRYPSPWTAKKEPVIEIGPENTKSNNNKDTSSSDSHRASPRRRSSAHQSTFDDTTIDMSAPRSTSGTYWKSEYETYSSKSTAEMRKLAKKEQLAKKYARDRDDEAAKLADALKREQQRVQELEKQVTEYVLQLSLAVKEYEADGKLGETDEHERERKERPQKDAKQLEEQMKMLMEENRRLKAEIENIPRHEQHKHETPGLKAAPNLSSSTDSKSMWLEVLDDEQNQQPRRRRIENKDTTTRAALQTRDANPLISSPFPGPDKTRLISSDIGRSYRRHDVKERETIIQKSPSKSHAIANIEDVVDAARSVRPGAQTHAESEADGKRLSDERKEAAKRRLEEKRRLRASQPVGA